MFDLEGVFKKTLKKTIHASCQRTDKTRAKHMMLELLSTDNYLIHKNQIQISRN